MKKYNVLIVDDSAFMRKAITKLIEQDEKLHVVGIARNGIDAIEKINRLKPDVITLDIDMPEMDGITALRKIMVECPLPVIMLSNVEYHEATTSINCIQMGAVDFFVKDRLFNATAPEEVENFLEKIRTATQAKVQPTVEVKPFTPDSDELEVKSAEGLIIIGCSTGGPSALQSILPHFSKNFPLPIVVIQHMPKGFTKPLADRFNSICALNVKEVEYDGELLEPGNIYIAPAGFQTTITKRDHTYLLNLSEHSPIPTLYHPSVDVTLLSAAPLFQDKLVTAILTGMGQDGLLGSKEVKRYNGRILVEAEETCVVYGMPKVVFEEGIADLQTPLHNMYKSIMAYM